MGDEVGTESLISVAPVASTSAARGGIFGMMERARQKSLNEAKRKAQREAQKPSDGESFLRVHWVAVPKAVRARRNVNRLYDPDARAAGVRALAAQHGGGPDAGPQLTGRALRGALDAATLFSRCACNYLGTAT
eukprot:COSAG01_NODE_1543_length_9973_cov_3.152015_3_plen_134_part_00